MQPVSVSSFTIWASSRASDRAMASTRASVIGLGAMARALGKDAEVAVDGW